MGNDLKRFAVTLAAVLLLISALPAAALEEKEELPKPALTVFILYAIGKSNTEPVMPGFYKITVPSNTAGIPEAEVLVKRDTFEVTVTPKNAVEASASRIARDDMALTISGLKEGKARIGIAAFTSTYDNKKPLYSQSANVTIEAGGSQAVLVPEDLKSPPKVYDSYTEAMNAVMAARKDSFSNSFVVPAQETKTIAQNIVQAMNPANSPQPGAIRFVLAYPFGPSADFSATPDFYQITLRGSDTGEPDTVFGINRGDKKIDTAAESFACYLSNGPNDNMYFDVFGIPSGTGREIKVSAFPIGAATGPVLLESNIKIDVPGGGMIKVTVPPGSKYEITSSKGSLSEVGYAGEDVAVAVAAAKLKPEDLAKPDWLLASDNMETSVIGLDWNVSARESVTAKIEGAPSAAAVGDGIKLSATSESAKNSLRWRQIAGPSVVISDPGAAKITITPKEPGVYSFLLEATSGGVSNFDFATVNVVGKKAVSAPKPADTLQLKDTASRMFLFDNLLLVPSDSGALIDSYDVSNPLRPTLHKRFLLPAEGPKKLLLDTAMAGNLFFTVSGVFPFVLRDGPIEYSASPASGYISIYRFLPQEKLEIAGMFDVDSAEPALSISGKFAYIVSGTDITKLVLSVPFPADNPAVYPSNDPLFPKFVADKLSTPADSVPLVAWDAPGGRFLIAAAKGKNSIDIYNVAKPDKPEKSGSVQMRFAPADKETNARVFGGTAIVWPAKNTAGETCNVSLLDISNPSKPSEAGTVKIDGDCPSDALIAYGALYFIQGRKLLIYDMGK